MSKGVEVTVDKGKGRIGSSFDSWLKEERLYEEAACKAIRRVLAWQVEQAMQEKGLTRSEMAKRHCVTRLQASPPPPLTPPPHYDISPAPAVRN